MTTEKPMGLDERLGTALKLRDISQQKLERKAGLSKGYVSRMRHGERTRISAPILERIADALQVKYEWLATGRGDMLPASPPELGSSGGVGPGGRDGSASRQAPLEIAVAYHEGEWSNAAIAAARELAKEAGALKRTPRQWSEVLLQIEAALKGIREAER